MPKSRAVFLSFASPVSDVPFLATAYVASSERAERTEPCMVYWLVAETENIRCVLNGVLFMCSHYCK